MANLPEFYMAQLLKWEGGKVDHPDDPGGRTNFGITIGTLKFTEQSGITSVGKTDPFDLTKNDSMKWYNQCYSYYKFDKIKSLPIRMRLFDFWVNAGFNSQKAIQKILDLKSDGVLGEATIEAINESNSNELYWELLKYIRAYYEKLGLRKPMFIKGWRSRYQWWENAPDTILSQLKNSGKSTPKNEYDLTDAELKEHGIRYKRSDNRKERTTKRGTSRIIVAISVVLATSLMVFGYIKFKQNGYSIF